MDFGMESVEYLASVEDDFHWIATLQFDWIGLDEGGVFELCPCKSMVVPGAVDGRLCRGVGCDTFMEGGNRRSFLICLVGGLLSLESGIHFGVDFVCGGSYCVGHSVVFD